MRQHLQTLALVAALAFAPAAFAAPPTAAQADRLLEVMRARETVDAILPQVQMSQQQMVVQLTAGQELDAADRARLEQLMQRNQARMVEALAWEKLEPVYRDIYLATFTSEDMDAMIGFYSSDAGQKPLDRMPQLMQNTMAAVQQMVIPMLQEMEQDIRAIAAGE